VDTSKVDDYGKMLPAGHLEGIQSGARIANDNKRNAADFAVWKFNTTGKKRDMERESPRGVGFPGWHIECSAMSHALL
jgi:cysteinyl-tRNA synthetase